MLGYMFWAAECPGTRSLCTTPPNACEGGVGVGSKTYDIPIPMLPLRQSNRRQAVFDVRLQAIGLWRRQKPKPKARAGKGAR
jgi:hypothetical protein